MWSHYLNQCWLGYREINLIKIWIKIQAFSWKKMYVCSGLKGLILHCASLVKTCLYPWMTMVQAGSQWWRSWLQMGRKHWSSSSFRRNYLTRDQNISEIQLHWNIIDHFSSGHSRKFQRNSLEIDFCKFEKELFLIVWSSPDNSLHRKGTSEGAIELQTAKPYY